MNNNVKKNYIYNLSYQILTLILPLVTTPYLSRVLGAEGVGIYSYTISIVTYFVLFGSLGIATYAQREIAYVQDDKKKRSKILYEVVFIRTITLLISIVFFYFIFAYRGEYSIYYKILIFELIANMVDISAFFQGMEEFKKIIKRNLIVKTISIASIFLFIKTQSDIGKYLLIYTLSNLIGNLSLWLYLPKYVCKINFKELNLLKHLKPTFALFIPQIATQIYTVLDKTMIGSMVLDKAEVGYYEQSQKIIKVILTLATSLGTVMLPRIANDFVKGNMEKIKNSINESFNFIYFMTIPMMFGIIAVASDLVPWFLGEGFDKAIYIIYTIFPIILMIGLSSVIGTQFLLPTKKQKQFTLSVVLGAVVNLVFNFIFIPKYFSVGAAIGTVIAETAVTIIQFYFIRKEFDIKDILVLSIKYFISAIVMFVFILLLNKFLVNISVVIRMGIDVVIGVIIYIILLILLKDEFIINNLDKILKRIGVRTSE